MIKVFEFATDRKEIIYQMGLNRSKFISHLIKVFYYGKYSTYNHWKKEIYNFYKRVDLLRNNKFPDSKMIYDAMFGKSEDRLDSIIKQDLRDFADDYSDMEICKARSNEEVKSFMREYSEWASSELSKYGVLDRSSVYSKIDSLMDKYHRERYEE